MQHPDPHIFSMTPADLRDWCAERGMPAFRAQQILDWVYRKGVIDPARMTNLSAKDRETLAGEMTFLSGETVANQAASDGTRKLLIQWDEGEPNNAGARALPLMPDASATKRTECVMIPTDDRKTACISSQVGCPVGCRFCASGLDGLAGNLSAGRIVEQVWRLDRLVKNSAPGDETARSPTDGGQPQKPGAANPLVRRAKAARPAPTPATEPSARVTNVVFMGMGEPLANFSAVTAAVRALAADWGMGISARKITISTVGMHRAIERLADELDLPVTLALSLHAPNDVLRRELIPWAEFTTIDQLLAACALWFEKTGREITLEYALLGGVNDRPEHARELASVAKRLRANVNLIRYNEVSGLPFARPETADVRAFQQILSDAGVNAHIRASRGRDIAAACGQLRREKRHAGASA